MSERKYVVKEFATSDPTLFIEVVVRYVGKPSYSGDEKQGYWLSVLPFTRKREGNTTWRTTAGYSGAKRFLEPATRYNERYMCNIALDWQWINEWVENKVMQMNVELAKEAAND